MSTPARDPWNFNAGPSTLPPSVLAQAAADLERYRGPYPQGAGISVMCMSHRSKEFEEIMATAQRNVRELLQVPETHTILFLHGGGTGGFASAPLNLTQKKEDIVSYAVTGCWSAAAAKEAAKYATVEILVDAKDASGSYTSMPPVSTWKPASAGSKYVHVCYNETQHGVAFDKTPDVPAAASSSSSSELPLLVADMSSCFLSAPIRDFHRYAAIYAGAQKNVGPAGVTVYIVRKDLLEKGPQSICPTILDWSIYAKSQSMYNTPCTWSIYIMNLVLEWVKEQGGVQEMERSAKEKADLVYNFIDSSSGGFYRAFVPKEHAAARSRQNIVFYIPANPAAGKEDREQNKLLQTAFIAESEKAGLIGLAGHRNMGAMRASLYNGMPMEGCQALVEFMKKFMEQHTAQAK